MNSEVGRLIIENESMVKRKLCKLKRPSEWIEDVFQDSAMKAIEKFEQLIEKEKFLGWFTAICFNTARNRMRSERRAKFDELYDWSHPDPRPSALDQLIEDEHHSAVHDMLLELPNVQSKIMLMYVVSEKSFQEIAKELGKPYDTVKANYRVGMLKLRGKYGQCD